MTDRAPIHIPARSALLMQAADAVRMALDSGADIIASHGDPAIRVAPTDAAPMVHCQTSGSSGQAKTVRRSLASWLVSIAENRTLFGMHAGDHYALLGHPGHSLTLYGMVEALTLNATLTLAHGLSPRRQVQAISDATVLYATPTQLRLLVRGAGGATLPNMRLILSGGGRLDAQTRADVQMLCPNAELVDFYGASETSFITLARADAPAGSVGTPYPGVQIQIRDTRDGIGEIWVASPYLFDSYASGDGPDTRRDGDWLTVGEMGQITDGALFLKGRRSRMFTVADQNVFPEDVEELLASDPEVSTVVALPVPDAARGQVLCAVLPGPEDAALTDRLTALSQAQLPPASRPRAILYHPDFPYLPSGKPDLVALADWLEGRA